MSSFILLLLKRSCSVKDSYLQGNRLSMQSAQANKVIFRLRKSLLSKNQVFAESVL